ncbi:MAG: hypothetical protein P8X55_04815, partial [Desulfosarcinaceae bacterium]
CPVDRITIIDFNGPFNAFTCPGQNRIWLYRRVFWNESKEELHSIAEHEAMHLLCDRLDLAASSRMRGLYAELMGYGLFSREHLFVLANGWPPPAMGEACGVNVLFDFINERNFIRGMNGGHSREHLDEFCASYLHSLLYFDRLGVLLRSPIILPDGSKARLSPSEQARLLFDYRKVLDSMLAAGSAKAPGAVLTFMRTRLAAMDRIDITGPSGPTSPDTAVFDGSGLSSLSR